MWLKYSNNLYEDTFYRFKFVFLNVSYILLFILIIQLLYILLVNVVNCLFLSTHVSVRN